MYDLQHLICFPLTAIYTDFRNLKCVIMKKSIVYNLNMYFIACLTYFPMTTYWHSENPNCRDFRKYAILSSLFEKSVVIVGRSSKQFFFLYFVLLSTAWVQMQSKCCSFVITPYKALKTISCLWSLLMNFVGNNLESFWL